MRLKDKKIGLVVTGSFCTLEESLPEISRLLKEGAQVFPVVSDSVHNFDTRFGSAEHWHNQLEEITGHRVISSIVEAEPIGPQKLFDLVVVAPCTGNTLAKLANGITDTPALMATKAHLRNLRPVVLAISTNDGLGINAKNLGLVLNMKNIYLVPFGQDNPLEKANSLVAHLDLLTDTVVAALEGRQLQPVLLSPKSVRSGL
jgi:dipicolinate synthase subunit B